MADPLRLTPAQARALMASHEARLRRCEPWSPAMPWKPELNLRGSTYRVLPLWPDVAASDAHVGSLSPGQYVDSPTQRFRYCVRLHARGRPMHTWWGNQVGTVVFDGDVLVPALYEAREPDDRARGHWHEHPWMSLTPAEMLTLRPGTRLARGRVVVAGLGLGHQLIEVSKRIQVKRITLVERDDELVQWILPRVRPHLKKPVEVIVGDAYEVLPTLAADVALVDIFPGYGDGHGRVAALRRACRKIATMWGWGTEAMTGIGQR